ncbi:MAG TPA: NADH-ubiquinone oxidoreductase-F iron-sulfur binding region domain-containing protein [Tenuifilaceae bacterium]|nr:NADH-ubiquinone oxidoreductase-F iron-sulfur binding region domain-containing protein [Tenuifilaceae bacterium]HPJ46192.1 NADH-ubiquinone oxidoreductase-F iron-sulfur binding region domain-containing protein [Tenuifilaceae bacterium]
MVEEKRIALKNSGLIDPEDINDYIRVGGYDALKKALNGNPSSVIDELTKAGLRGRGGAGFPTGTKNLSTAATCTDCNKYVVCNADEGEPGTFKDRIIMETDPHILVEGMIIAGYGIGANQGYIYIRGEYYTSIERIKKAIEQAYSKNFLGEKILGSKFTFNLEIKLGAGSYLCGEELTLLESLEGKRGYPRIKPPFPAQKGLWGKPTLINNVETLANFPAIVLNGGKWYQSMGTEKSPGTKIFTISGDVKNSGHRELILGAKLGDIINNVAGGTIDGKPWKAALLGGAAGTFVPYSFADVEMGYDKLKERGATLGSGAIIVIGSEKHLIPILQSILKFFKHESCGKCVPCRLGTSYLHEQSLLLNKKNSEDRKEILNSMLTQAQLIAKSSLCPLGQSPILPIQSIINHFSDALINE